MNRLLQVLVLAALFSALAVPATAYAESSKYVRKSPSSTAYSASSTSKWARSSQGSTEEGGIAGMFCSIYSRTSSSNSWTSRKTVLASPGHSASSSVASNGTSYYWRLGLSGPLAEGYGVLNIFN
jgi:hypothetical protein